VSTNSPIAVVINGEERSIPHGQTIRELLESLQLNPAQVAVEMDRRIVKQQAWDDTAVPVGARLEIVRFVGGG